MSSTHDHLERWRAAGLLDEETAQRIAAFERAESEAQPEPPERPGLAEAAVYLAAVVIGVGLFVLTAVQWEHFGGMVRIALASLSAAAALILGAILWNFQDERLRRGASVVWLLASGLCATTAAVSAYEADARDANIAAAAALTLLLVSAGLISVSPRHPQVLALASGVLLLGAALAARLDNDNSQLAFGLSVATLGLVGLALAETTVIRPRSSARVFASLLVVVGAAFTGFPPTHGLWELVAFAAGALLAALSFWRAQPGVHGLRSGRHIRRTRHRRTSPHR